jgi:hypothetical protein
MNMAAGKKSLLLQAADFSEYRNGWLRKFPATTGTKIVLLPQLC